LGKRCAAGSGDDAAWGWNNINGLRDVSAIRASLGDSRLSTQGQLMSFRPSGGVAAASPSAALPPASDSERFPIPS
ncbi:MAG TPA: hypothetical protein VGR59_09075, partial [Gemmatimonadaceae bacterium]|nr:hypothetical protein [Gemmatimonadaceae bacterium]